MIPRGITEPLVREPVLLRTTDNVETAVRRIVESGLPALPVIDDRDRFKGIFGEREFMSALFPGYLGQLKHAAFLTHSIDEALEKRDSCRAEHIERYMTTDHVDVGPDFSDAQVAEIFLHHRVLIIPIVDAHHVVGLITRHDFFRAMAKRFMSA